MDFIDRILDPDFDMYSLDYELREEAMGTLIELEKVIRDYEDQAA